MHSHFATTGWTYRKLSRNLQIPHVVSFYGFDYESLLFRKPVWRKRYNELFEKADLFICEGTNGAEILRKIGCPPEKIRVARLGVDTSTIPFSRRSKKPGELNLLQIANFIEKKGHKYTIEAFKAALKNCPNMTLTFVGSERQHNLKSILQQEVNNTDARDKVLFHEAIDFKRLYEFMTEYQVFIHPSCHTDEMDCEGGAPVVLLDAQATGMPVISTMHCDIPDEVRHGHTGLLSPEKDSALLAESIEKFYHMDQEQYDAFARNARDHVNQHYDASANFAAVRDIYGDILNNRK